MHSVFGHHNAGNKTSETLIFQGGEGAQTQTDLTFGFPNHEVCMCHAGRCVSACVLFCPHSRILREVVSFI